MHAIFTLPDGDADFSRRWQRIKALFTSQLGISGVSMIRDPRGEYLLWQRRFWEHTIRNETDFAQHVDFIHFNPVNMVWCHGSEIGLTRHSTAMPEKDLFLKIGAAISR